MSKLDTAQDGPPSTWGRAVIVVCAALLSAGLAALGTWQVQRLFWKQDLIARVEARVHAPAVDAPGPSRWAGIDAASDEYRHVRVAGTYLHEHETLVQANTVLGAGFWVMTPLRLADGATTVLINRGFVPPEARARASRAETETQGVTTVTGLLRLSEPHGGFLRRNDPAAQRWFSRDVQAISAARRLGGHTAPYFIDADAGPASFPAPSDAPVWPAGGLTVVSVPHKHLGYAVTWYVLALMVAGGAWYALRDGRRQDGRDGDVR